MHRLSAYTRKLFRFAHCQSLSCGKVPLLILLAVVVCMRLGGAPTAPKVAPPLAGSELAAADENLIDAVLSRRAQESWRAGYDPLMILAIIEVESSFEDEAVSPKGARGLMQIQPTTLKFLTKKEGIRLTPE